MVIDWQVVLIVITFLLAAFALYKIYQGGGSVSATEIADQIKAARPIAIEISEIAQVAVNATEELRRQGKITENKVALSHAFDLTRKWIPDEWEISNEDIFSALDAAILVASALRNQADSLKSGYSLKTN